MFVSIAKSIMSDWLGIRTARKSWKIAQLKSDIFCAQLRDIGYQSDPERGLKIAGNFIPERYENSSQAMKGLKIIVQTLNIRDLRIGIRWSTVCSENETIDLNYYQPFLDYCFDNDVKIVLAIGPIKSPAYPEEYIPDWVWKSLHKPPRKFHTIRAESELAYRAYEYNRDLLKYLKTNLSPSKLSKIKYFQVENEPFTRFGHLMLKSTPEYLRKIIIQTQSLFPEKPILLNSSGRLGLRQILHTLEPLHGRFCIGQDYYYQDQWRTWPVWKIIEPMGSLLLPWNVSNTQLQQKAIERGYFLEITEAQMEPWHPIYEPGNSVVSLQFVLYICLISVFNRYTKAPVIRLWGLEYLTSHLIQKKENSAHREIVAVIRNLTLPKKI
jgi:hypothetical protein